MSDKNESYLCICTRDICLKLLINCTNLVLDKMLTDCLYCREEPLNAVSDDIRALVTIIIDGLAMLGPSEALTEEQMVHG